VPFSHGTASGGLQDVLSGFLDADVKAMGRPLGVAIESSGAFLVANDVGNKVWRVVPHGKTPRKFLRPC
jgi:glucose/arabinose dehydrogenase